MSNRLHTILSFNIPFSIPAPDGVYAITVDGKEALITIRRIQREQVEGFVVEGTRTMQIQFDKYGRSSYSRVEIKFPWQMDLQEHGRKPLLLGDIPPRRKAKELALKFVNRFIEVIRYVTEEYWLEPVRYQDILSFEDFYWDGKQRTRAGITLIDTGVGGIRISTGHPFQLSHEKIEQINALLKGESKQDISKILLMNAKDAVLMEDFRLATLEGVTALETVLSGFIRKRGEQTGISKEKLEDFIVKVGLTGNLEVVLRMLTEGLEQIDGDTLELCKGAITTRNNILHEGLMDVSPTETERRILSIEKMILYLQRLLESISSKSLSRQ